MDLPLTVGQVILTEYDAGAEWRPAELSPGQAVLEMISHTVPARIRPEDSLAALERAVSDAVVLRGNRGEARSLAREQALELIRELQAAPHRFGELALQHSVCPSKAQGGALGQISKGQTVPEFERQLFRLPVGLCQQPLESRYGYHLVLVDQRIEGEQLPYEVVAGSIRAELNQRVWQIGVSQYLQNLVGAAHIDGIQMQGADTPLMQ